MARKKTKKTKKKRSSKSRRKPRKTKKRQTVRRTSRKKTKFQAPKGTFDILPKQQKYWDRVERLIDNLASAYGF